MSIDWERFKVAIIIGVLIGGLVGIIVGIILDAIFPGYRLLHICWLLGAVSLTVCLLVGLRTSDSPARAKHWWSYPDEWLNKDD